MRSRYQDSVVEDEHKQTEEAWFLNNQRRYEELWSMKHKKCDKINEIDESIKEKVAT
jgi:hypothetical protein